MIDGVFDYIRGVVYRRSAIVLEPGKEYLVETRLGPILKEEGLASFDGLVAQLKLNEGGRLGVRVIEAMTTNETSFFRDIHPFETLKSVLLPTLMKARPNRCLRIWSAAASTGQEPFSIAMAIRDVLPDVDHWDIKIIATDLNRTVLARARTGTFKQLEVNRGLPARQLTTHFERCGVEWKVRPEILGMVTFAEMNLLDRWRAIGPQDIIFMRNVLIYFDVETRRRILGHVTRVLPADGYLVLGGAETTLNVNDRFSTLRFGSSVVYQPRGQCGGRDDAGK